MNVKVDRGTKFSSVKKVSGCQIDRFTLECLGEEYGGLTRGQRMQMKIIDDVVTLRSQYSGFWQWIHVCALLAFAAPYLWFLAQQWSEIRFNPPASEGLRLWEAFARYVVNGGVGWREGWSPSWVLGLFTFSLLYNVLRGALLWKTKTLEMEELARGLPVKFSLMESWWGFWLKAAGIGFGFNVLVVILHTAHFMWEKIPGTVR